MKISFKHKKTHKGLIITLCILSLIFGLYFIAKAIKFNQQIDYVKIRNSEILSYHKVTKQKQSIVKENKEKFLSVIITDMQKKKAFELRDFIVATFQALDYKVLIREKEACKNSFCVYIYKKFYEKSKLLLKYSVYYCGTKPLVYKKEIKKRVKKKVEKKYKKPEAKLAVVIENVGCDMLNLEKFLDLNINITFAILPRQAYSYKSRKRIEQTGCKYILNQPMQPIGYPEIKPPKGALFINDNYEYSTDYSSTQETFDEDTDDLDVSKSSYRDAYISDRESYGDLGNEYDGTLKQKDIKSKSKEDLERDRSVISYNDEYYVMKANSGDYDEALYKEEDAKPHKVKKKKKRVKRKQTSSISLMETIFHQNVESVGGYIKGVSNNMGSAFTQDDKSMTKFLSILKKRNMFFLDSRTTCKSIAKDVATKLGVLFVEKRLFLDVDTSLNCIREKLNSAMEISRRTNKPVVVIGSSKSVNLIAALKEIKEKVEFVFVEDCL